MKGSQDITKFVSTKQWMLDLASGRKSEDSGRLEPYLPSKFASGDTIGIEVTSNGLIYFKHNGKRLDVAFRSSSSDLFSPSHRAMAVVQPGKGTRVEVLPGKEVDAEDLSALGGSTLSSPRKTRPESRRKSIGSTKLNTERELLK